MKMKHNLSGLIVLLCLYASCNSGAPSTGKPAPVSVVSLEIIDASAQEAEKTEEAPLLPVLPAADTEEKSFQEEHISEEVYAATKIDIKNFIAELNKVIRAQDYNTWITHLSDVYLREIESPAFLSQKTEELYARSLAIAKGQKKNLSKVPRIELKTAKDYFKYVVVPSRKNDHVDDIEYISENEVIAWTQNGGRAKLDILYYLENTGGNWKITNPPQQDEKK